MRDDESRALDGFARLRPIRHELRVYADLLRRWQRKINLVGPATLGALWWRHFADSVQVLDECPTARRWVDLGSGAGFPGMIVALALKGDETAEVTLVESDTRKAAFLREVSRETGAGASIVTRRAEDVVATLSAPDAATSRALMPVDALARLTKPWLRAGTVGVFLSGEAVASTMEDDPDLCESRTPSRTGPGFVVSLRFRESGWA